MVFCFEQKTAYEMRMRDWSSDVCSSDLQLVFRAEKASAPVKVTSSPVSDRQWPEGVREYDGVPLADLVTEANRYATGPMLVASADIRDTRVERKCVV